ncbi:MAG: hypothetical protein ACKVH8_20990 [Pirellulales bacterium]
MNEKKISFIRQYWIKIAAGFGLLLVVTVLLLPTLARYGPLRHWILEAAFQDEQVTVSIGDLNLGWTQPTELVDLSVKQKSGNYDVQVKNVTNDIPFWKLLVNPRQLGNITIIEPQTKINLTSNNQNVADAMEAESPLLDLDSLSDALNRSIEVVIKNASIEVTSPKVENNWKLERMSFAGQLQPMTDADGPRLILEEVQLIDQLEISEGMCDDLLKFAAPMLHDVTKVSGKVSLSFSEWEIPIAQPKKTVGKGRLQIHSAQIQGGPLAQSIIETLGLPQGVQIASDCDIQIEIKKERVYHQGLEMGLNDFKVRTNGSVGFDDTIDIVCVIPIPIGADVNQSHPILNALKGEQIEVSIGGTLDDPKIKGELLGDSLLKMAESSLGKLPNKKEGEPSLFNNDKLSGNQDPDLDSILKSAEGVLGDFNLGDGKLLEKLRENRLNRESQKTDRVKEEGEDPQPNRGGFLKNILDQVEQIVPEPEEPDSGSSGKEF